MGTKKPATTTDGVVIPLEAYQHGIAVMDELAFRGPHEEGLVMRIAKAFGMKDAMKTIIRRRMYLKKHQGGKQARSTEEDDQKKGGNKRRRSDRKKHTPKPAGSGESGAAGGSAESAA